MKRILTVMLCTAMLCSCREPEKNIAGIYVKHPSVNTIDSLFIFADSLQPTLVYNRRLYKYKQRFYNKKNGELLFENVQTWWLEDHTIYLDNLYLDEDWPPSRYSFSKERLKDAVTLSTLPIEWEKIWINEDMNVYYQKVD